MPGRRPLTIWALTTRSAGMRVRRAIVAPIRVGLPKPDREAIGKQVRPRGLKSAAGACLLKDGLERAAGLVPENSVRKPRGPAPSERNP